ncbi:MAG: hypothetical protein LQ342_008292 [Letrouitia transgressa]|nr:MAG: hypothetical protein LQ342_008292 [Letrouitia transgressa]
MASTSGFLGGVAGNPADVLNVRMQHDAALPLAQRRNYRHAFDGIVRMTREEGWRSLFRGVLPNSMRAVLMTASQLASYDGFKKLLLNKTSLGDSPATHFTASFLAGFVATTICSPVDVVKTRIMSAKDTEALVGLLTRIYKAEGVKWVFKGWVPSFIRGLICAPITASLTSNLDLPQMVLENADPNRTAYTISIDGWDDSITTGISAHDRALTCRMLASPSANASTFRRPGHVFPLRAREGGIRERKGHTEAAVEFCRLAGKRPVGVICELVQDGEEIEGKAERRDGGMMRRDECLRFGKKWGLKVCTIEDLDDYVENRVVCNGRG